MDFDKNSKLEYGVYLSDAKNIKIGKYCRINENVFIQGDVKIGDYVMIAPNVAIHSSTHIYKSIEVPMVLNGLTDNKRVLIEDDVWIGRNVIVLPGIRIGKGSIIGANSVVNRDIEEYSIYGGVPAKFIKKRK
ncbi:acyltransferase [Polaribacter reichenbachii]|nr:acyltransferase [Polaribacter reichenbachii]